jgi:hypothetical protein
MGYNRSGTRRTARQKRAKKYFARVLAKHEAATQAPGASAGAVPQPAKAPAQKS